MRWLKQRPAVYASIGAAVAFADGYFLFHDPRPPVIGGIATFLTCYIAWRPGGFGWRLEARDRQWAAEHGSEIRVGWLLSRLVMVVGAIASLIAIMLLVGKQVA